MEKFAGSSARVWVKHCAIIFAAWLAAGGLASAADFKGAAEVLRQAAQASPKPKEKSKDPFAPYRDKLKAFSSQSTNLPPAAAAAQWLALGDELEQVLTDAAGLASPGPRRGVQPVQFDEVMKVLPPPSAWAELEKAVDARAPKNSKAAAQRNLGLRLIAHTLTKNAAKRAEDLKALDALAKKNTGPNGADEFMSVFQVLNEAILATMDDPEAILRMLESQLPAPGSGQAEGGYPSDIHIPNLIALVGAAKAEAFLRQALKTSAPLEIDPGNPLHALALKIALEMVDQLPQPHWELVNSLDSVELFEAMDKKFNKSKKETAPKSPDSVFFGVNVPTHFDRNDAQARMYYFLGLIARDRTSDAIKVAKDFDRNNSVYFPPELIKQMERAGLTQQLNNFFAALLKDSPESPFWSEYVRVAAHAGHADDALALVRKTSESKDLTRTRRAELKALLPTALLANDEVDAGVSELRQSLTNKTSGPSRGRYSYASEMGNSALAIARIGQLLDRKDWIEEGITAAKAELETTVDQESYYGNTPEISLADMLSELHRGPEAEEVLLKALSKQIAKSQSPAGNRRFGSYGPGGTIVVTLVALLRVYYEAGRLDDVVRLLDDAEHWGVKDLLDIQNQTRSGFSWRAPSGHHTVAAPVSYFAASALAKTGRKQESAAILNHLFDQEPGLDRLYELLLELEPASPLARLDELFARDPFEERPLIWKAYWLRTHGKLEDAEQAAKKAISIDPSDGEEGPGDRLRAYAELAEIRAARGDAKEADFLRGAVAAIRESENADRLHDAGLLKRAVSMYQDSLTKFSDAYCIQSRLAIQLADLGKHEEAEAHYRKAYELMPESFGRVESHCFGCERAFEGERAQGIAERVFTQLAQKTPNKPQVHYLLGYLRDEQERPNEALVHYREAVRLDPDYLNAWHKIAEISAKTFVPAAERDSVVFNLLRLDPRHRHAQYGLNSVSDLATLWVRVAAANRSASPAVTSLYPLKESTKKLDRKTTEPNPDDESEMFQMREIYDEMQARTPASAVLQNGFIRAGATLISNSIRQLDE